MSNVNRGYQLRAVLLIVLISSATAAAQTTESIPGNPPQQAPANDTPPEPAGTGWRSLVREMHPADDYVEEHIVGDPPAEKFFARGSLTSVSTLFARRP